MSESRVLQSLFLLTCSTLLAQPVAAQLNLPQLDALMSLPDTTRAELEPALQQAAIANSTVLSAELEVGLVDLLPANLREGCTRMISHWGDLARGTAHWSIRPLRWQQRNGSLGALAAFRCGSTHPDYADNYDERLGLLGFGPEGARLRLVPLADDCDDCSDVFHIEFSRAFPLPEGELAELVAASSSDNPCCDGPSTWRREELLYLVLPGGAVALRVERSREEFRHDDEDGDWEEICGSMVMDTTVDERLVELTLHTFCRTNGEEPSQEARSYHWNAETGRFKALAGTQP